MRKRGEKSVLVCRAVVNIVDEITRNYLQVKTMDPMIEKFRSLYSRDLSERLGINERSLPPHLTFGVHLNPMFGSEERVIGSGLMTRTQYERSKAGESDHTYLFSVFILDLID